jgi:hypothetical protein
VGASFDGCAVDLAHSGADRLAVRDGVDGVI